MLNKQLIKFMSLEMDNVKNLRNKIENLSSNLNLLIYSYKILYQFLKSLNYKKDFNLMKKLMIGLFKIIREILYLIQEVHSHIKDLSVNL